MATMVHAGRRLAADSIRRRPRSPLVWGFTILLIVTLLPTMAIRAQSSLCVMGGEAGSGHPLLNNPLNALSVDRTRFVDDDGDGSLDLTEEIYLDVDNSMLVSRGDVRWSDRAALASGTFVLATDADAGNPLTALPSFVVRYYDNDGNNARGVGEPILLDLGSQQTVTVNDRYLAPAAQAGTAATSGSSHLNNPLNAMSGSLRYYDNDGNAAPSAFEAVFWDVNGDGSLSVADVCLSVPPSVATTSGSSDLTPTSTATTSSDLTPTSTATTGSSELTPTSTAASGLCVMGAVAGSSHPHLNYPLNILPTSRIKFVDDDGDTLLDVTESVYVDMDGTGALSQGDVRWTDKTSGPEAGRVLASADPELGYPLTAMPAFSFRMFDEDANAQRNGADPIFLDVGQQGTATVNDRYLAPASPAGTVVGTQSSILNYPLDALPGSLRYYDVDANNVPGANEPVFWDLASNGLVSTNDVCLSVHGSGSPASSEATPSTQPGATSTTASAPPPNSGFAWSPFDICVGATVTFFVEEQGHKGDAWNIDGSTPLAASVKHVFYTPGPKSVSVTSTSTSDTYSSTHKWISVRDCSATATTATASTAPEAAPTATTASAYQDGLGAMVCTQINSLLKCVGKSVAFNIELGGSHLIQNYRCGRTNFFEWFDVGNAGGPFSIGFANGDAQLRLSSPRVTIILHDHTRGLIDVELTQDPSAGPYVGVNGWPGTWTFRNDWGGATAYQFAPTGAVSPKLGVWLASLEDVNWPGIDPAQNFFDYEGAFITRSARWITDECLFSRGDDVEAQASGAVVSEAILGGKIGAESTIRRRTDGSLESQAVGYAGLQVNVEGGSHAGQVVAKIQAEGTTCKSVILKFDTSLFYTTKLNVQIEDTSSGVPRVLPTMESTSLEDAVDACQPGDGEAEYYVVLDQYGTQVITSFQRFSEKRVTVEAASVGNILIPGPTAVVVLVPILAAVAVVGALRRRT